MCGRLLFILIGLGFSVFYSVNAVYIFSWPKEDEVKPKMRKVWWWYQRWFNFIGSAVGWAAGYCFVFYRLRPLLESRFAFTVTDGVLLLLALLGITGLLPYTLTKIKSLTGQ